MKAQAPTTHGFNPNFRLFLILVAALVVAGIILSVGYVIITGIQEGAEQADGERLAAEQVRQEQIITELQGLWRNTIGPVGIEGFENFGFSYLSTGEGPNTWSSFNDKDQLQWANWVARNPDFCSKLYPNQTQPIMGCDFYKGGVWSYSLSPETAERQLQEDASKYNDLADNVACSALTANNLPCKLNGKGDPVQTSEQKVTVGSDGQYQFRS